MPRRTHDHLVDSKVRTLSTPGEELRDGLTPGLIVRVLPSGRKQWTLRYRTQGKQRRLVLGDYGPNAMTLSKARTAAEEARHAIRGGRDVVAERQAAKAKRDDTVSALAAEYLEQHARPRKRTAAEDERVLSVDVLPAIGDRPVRELTRREVRAVLERIRDRGAPYAANRTLEIVRKMLNWGIAHDWLDANPAARIEKLAAERSRDRVLTDDEIRQLWALLSRFPQTDQKQAPGRVRAMEDADGHPFCPINPALAAVQKLRLVTAQRGGEVLRMRWQDLDLRTGWWTIPAEHAKNGLAHHVPLTRDAIAIIEAQQRDECKRHGDVFADRHGRLPTERLKKAGAALARTLARGVARPSRTRKRLEIQKLDIRSHDLRRTAATRMASAGVPRLVIGKVLNHVEPGITAVYDRHSYDAEKRIALETWNRELARVLAEQVQSGHILPMTKRGA